MLPTLPVSFIMFADTKTARLNSLAVREWGHIHIAIPNTIGIAMQHKTCCMQA